MDSDEGETARTASSDTTNLTHTYLGSSDSTDLKLLIRGLQSLNTEDSAVLTSSFLTRQSTGEETLDVKPLGDAESTSETLPQAMKTMIGDKEVQCINLAESTDENGVSVYAPEVEVFVAPASSSFVEQSSGSNKVKINTVVKHVWDLKYYYGNLVAVHRDAVYVAYVLRGRDGCNVKVISCKNALRELLKPFTGDVVDIAFALSDDVCLAAVDEGGNVFVYFFELQGDKILSTLALHIQMEVESIESTRNFTRVIWCPYIPEDDNEDGPDPSKMLVLLHGTRAEVWNVDVVRDVGSGPMSSSDVSTGVMVIKPYEPSMNVVNAAFAPDGSAVAVAYTSGVVKFFLVCLDRTDADTGCMHDWNPHDGHPVSSLYFLDDHKHPGADLQLWKFALTGALYNTEIKLWSCESWDCMQTINFRAPLNQADMKLRFKSEIDLTSKYLALSDINSRVLYVLQIYQKYDSSTVHVSSLAQFSLAQPCLSFAIFEAGAKRFKHSAPDSHLDEITTGELNENQEDDEENEMRNEANMADKVTTGVQIKMYGVHTKALQELLIRYRPESSVPHLHASSTSSISQEDTGVRNMLSDVSMDQSEAGQDISTVPTETPHGMATPKHVDVSSPNVSSRNGALIDETLLSLSSTSSFTLVSAMKDDLLSIHSPRSSTDPSTVLSPSSTFTKTPSQSRPSPGANVSLTDVPLPPVTSLEEAELATPKSTGRANKDALDDLFGVTQTIGKGSGGLGNLIETASSTGSFPVSSILASYNYQNTRYDEDDQEVADALGLEKDESREEERVPSDQQEERKELMWPDPPDVFTQPKNEEIEENIQEEEEEKDFYDDENDEAEVEEIIQCHEADDEDDEVEASIRVRNYPKRSKDQDFTQTPVHVLTSIDTSIARLGEQLQAQQEMMRQMQVELNRQREIQLQLHRHQMEQEQFRQMTAQPSLEKDIGKLEDILVSRMEHSLAQHMQRETLRLQDSLKTSDAQRKQRDDLLYSTMTSEVSRSVKDAVSNTLRMEVKQTITPALYKFVEPMKEKIHQEVAHRLTACDTLLRENIAKAVKSRSTMDVLAASVGDVIYQQMQAAYTDTFKSAMLPSFKAVIEKTVRDVHGIFQQGTKEYQLYMRQNMDQMLRERVATDTIVGRMEAAEQKFLQGAGQMRDLVLDSVSKELRGQVAHAVHGIKDEVLRDVRKIMKEELNTAMKEHDASISDKLTTYLRSGAGTPVPPTSEEEISKERIVRELRLGRINDAFQVALSASNLDLVVFTLESAAPFDIFSKSPCPLSQPVLLSLISQLAANLDKNFDLKMKYLEEAVLNLDRSQPMTADHIPNVIGSLVQKLRAAEAHCNDVRKSRTIKMLIMAGNSLLT